MTVRTAPRPAGPAILQPPAPLQRPKSLQHELITAEQAARVLSISIRTVWRMLERGELPEPIRYNRKLVRWHYPTLLAHLDAIAAKVAVPTDAERSVA